MTRLWHGGIGACMLAGLLAAAANSLAQPAYSPLEDALRENVALRNDVIALKKARTEVQKAYGVCVAELGRLEVLVDEAVAAGKAAALVQAVEQAHPGFTVDPKTGALVAKAKPD